MRFYLLPVQFLHVNGREILIISEPIIRKNVTPKH